MTFGENLKQTRKAAGLTQAELAHRSGVTERSVYNYEKNSRAPKIDIVERFAEALHVSTEMLLDSRGADLSVASADRLLLQVQLLFESSLDGRKKDQFFQQVALAYFQYQNKGESENE